MSLSTEQLNSFHENGFLVVENVLADADIEPLETEYEELLDDKCQQYYERGFISDPLVELPFAERYAKLLTEYPDCVDQFNISLPLVNDGVDPDTYRAHFGPAVFGLQSNAKILDIVESVIGPEISSSPVQQMRIKPPQQQLDANSLAHSNVGITTWHQDTVAVLPEADNTDQVTVWVAVTDADLDNGCLASIPKSHLQGPQPHQPGKIAREPCVPDEIIDGRQGKPLPVKRGGIILFHKQNIHSSTPNRSARLRWSVDIRYHPTGQPSGRPAFPGFIARSRSNPESELRDPVVWQTNWEAARQRIINGEYTGPVFRDWE
ncbi:MAG: phytanoyl-CoA dioxygenase family protein [Pseudomonadota bacterium]